MTSNNPNTQAQEKFLEMAKDLPTLPTVVAQVMVTLDQPTSSARDLERLVANDQAIAARLLKLANSAFYGLPGKVTSLGRAITLLGFNTVRSLVLTIGVIDKFNGAKGSESFDRGDFWEHSLSVAVASRILATKDPGLNPDEAHIAGLLHDMGTIILDSCVPEKFEEAMTRWKNGDGEQSQYEREVIGLTHEEAGALVATKWRFPDFIKESMAYHHHPNEAQQHPEVVQVVALANEMVKAFHKQEELNEELSVPDVYPELRNTWLPTPRHEELFITKYEVDVEKVQDILALFGE
ncbi:MAG TPA: HDOD domain-containing protein [bacterium]|jgi:putative nucleotidyltransferase with HDIG domain